LKAAVAVAVVAVVVVAALPAANQVALC
jgi:hypothetical protein